MTKLIIALVLITTSTMHLALAEAAKTKPDNTAINSRDQNSTNLTPEDQSRGSSADVELTRQVREEISSNKELSVYAKNIKIITINGVITLRGPVRTESERSKIASIAQQKVGAEDVRNELQIQNR